MAVTHFVTQFTHISRHFIKYGLRFKEKIAYVSIKLLFEKSAKM